MRRGFTLPELLVVIAIIGILTTFAMPRFTAMIDAIEVRGATSDIAAACALARQLAISHGAITAVDFDTAGATITVHRGTDTIAVRRLAELRGVTIAASRDSLAYNALGIGYGASNLRVIARRGRAVDTLFVSRVGRVRR